MALGGISEGFTLPQLLSAYSAFPNGGNYQEGVFVKKIIDNAPEVTPADVRPQGFTTFVYADDGDSAGDRA